MNLREAIRVVDPCVVQVSGETLRPMGTGFFVHGEGYVVTALHVLGTIATAASEANRPVQVNVGIASANTEKARGSFTFTACRVVDADDVHDLALLQLRLNPFVGEVEAGVTIGDRPPPASLATAAIDPSRPEDGEAIAVSGYPLSRAALITTAGHLASVWESESRRDSPSGEAQVVDWYLGDLQVDPASAGGPAYRVETAEVIAVCGASRQASVRMQDNGTPATPDDVVLAHGSRATPMTPAKYIVGLLSRHGLWPVHGDGGAEGF